MAIKDESSGSKWEPSDSLRSLAYMVREIGLSTLVVLFLLGQQAGWIESPHNKIIETVSKNQVIIRSVDSSTKDAAQSLDAICYINAKDAQERRICRYGVQIVIDRD